MSSTDYGSGDADPVDGQWNRFDGLFGHRRVELAPTSIYGALGRENIDTVGVRVSVAPSTRTDAFAVYRVVRLAAAADAFASTGVRDPTGQSGRDGGQQIDVRFRTWIQPGVVRLELGATHLIAGRFLRSAPNATREGNTTFFYGDVTYSLTSKPTGANSNARPWRCPGPLDNANIERAVEAFSTAILPALERWAQYGASASNTWW